MTEWEIFFSRCAQLRADEITIASECIRRLIAARTPVNRELFTPPDGHKFFSFDMQVHGCESGRFSAATPNESNTPKETGVALDSPEYIAALEAFIAKEKDDIQAT